MRSRLFRWDIPVILILGGLVGLIAIYSPIEGLGVIAFITMGSALVISTTNRTELPTGRFTRLLLWAAILSPNLELLPGVPAIRAEEILLLLFCVVWLIRRKDRLGYARPPGLILLPILTFVICSSILLSPAPSSRDLMEIVKLMKYAALIWIGFNCQFEEPEIELLLRDLYMATTISSGVAFAQFFNVLNINDWLSPLYAPSQLEGIVVYKRVTGTTANPNQFGLLLLFSIAIGFSFMLHTRGHLRLTKVLATLSLGACLIALALTGSRTGIVAVVVTLGLLLFVVRGRSEGRKLTVILFVSAVVMVFMNWASEFWWDRMVALADPFAAGTFQRRTLKWAEAFPLFLKAPILGWGPNKVLQSDNALDNEYMLILYRYGTLGLVSFLAGMVGIWVRLGTRKVPAPMANTVRLGLFGAVGGALIYMVTAALYHDLQVMSVFSLIVGVALSVETRAQGNQLRA